MKHYFSFAFHDNGGGRQYFKVQAESKEEAIKKGFEKAKKKSKGDCIFWECRLMLSK